MSGGFLFHSFHRETYSELYILPLPSAQSLRSVDSQRLVLPKVRQWILSALQFPPIAARGFQVDLNGFRWLPLVAVVFGSVLIRVGGRDEE